MNQIKTILILLMFLVAGCATNPITGNVVSEKKEITGDDFKYYYAVRSKNASLCSKIEFGSKRDECFVRIATSQNNELICYFVDSLKLRESCLEWAKKSK